MVEKSIAHSRAWLLGAVLLMLGLAVAVTLASHPTPSRALAPLDVQVDKAVDHFSILPGHLPAPLYTVTFSNPYTTPVVLDWITDTLPAGFIFVNMDPSSDWDEDPVDQTEPGIVWQGPITIPATDTLKLVYAVYVPTTVPRSPIPYQNSVIASAGTQLIGPAGAALYVGAPQLGMIKSVEPRRVLNGQPVVYTVSITNSGELTGTVELITDTLDPSLSYVGIAPGSDVTEPPVPVGNSLVWTVPHNVAAGDDLVLKYEVSTPGGTGWSWPCNRAEALAGAAHLGPAETCIEVGPGYDVKYLPLVHKHVQWAVFSVSKSVYPTTIMAMPGATVDYTVIIQNTGDHAGVLGSVVDTLPAGFTYMDMVPGSDVLTDPLGATGTITWNGPFTVPAHDQLELIYRVAIGQAPGQYTNLANATALVGKPPAAPAAAQVTVQPGILLEEHFNSSIDAWTKFTNYWRLKPSQWFWGEGAGVTGGAATHRCCDDPDHEAHDALLMYLADGAEQWTDYRVEAKFNMRQGTGPVGLWVRGQWEPSDIRAQWVTGYYIVAGGRATADTHFVKLTQLQTATDCWGAACSNPENLYNFNNSHEITQMSLPGPLTRNAWHTMVVEVRGARIMAWLDGDLAIDWTDPKEPFYTGTIGFKTYKADEISYDDVIVTPLQ